MVGFRWTGNGGVVVVRWTGNGGSGEGMVFLMVL